MSPIGAQRNLRPRATAARMAASTVGLSRRPRRERKKAVLVGVAEGEDDADASDALRAHLDVEKIREVLLNHCGYREKDIAVMLDRQDSPKHLRPTQRNIERRLKRLTRKAEAGDKFFFFYAGHGEQRPCLSESESDGFDEFISCERGRSIKDNRLRELLVDPLPPGAQLFALFDTCHAGTMLDLPHTARSRVFSICFVVGRLQRVFACVRLRSTTTSGMPSGLGREVEVEVQFQVAQRRMEALGVASRCSTRHRSSLSCITNSTTGTSTHASSAPQPRVLALSSTADHEQSWESDEGGPLASAFASVLAACAASGTLTPRKLLREFQRVMAAKHVERVASVDAWYERHLHQSVAKGAEWGIGGADEDEVREWMENAKSVQRPQMSSLQPLDMDMPLSL